jgi:hypothetical protein
VLHGDDHCRPNNVDQSAACSGICGSEVGPNTPSKIGKGCSPATGYNCTNWNPGSHVTLSGGVYQVNATWFASLVANLEPLYACDDGEFHSSSDHTRFVISNLDSDDFLYAIGLRNSDKVQTINGITINAFSAGYTAYALYLNGTTSYSVTITRGGSTITLSISLV